MPDKKEVVLKRSMSSIAIKNSFMGKLIKKNNRNNFKKAPDNKTFKKKNGPASQNT